MPLAEIHNHTTDEIVDMMKYGKMYSLAKLNSGFGLTVDEIKEIGKQKVCAIWDDIYDAVTEETRSFGYFSEDIQGWFNIEKYAEEMLEDSSRYIQLSSGRVVRLK